MIERLLYRVSEAAEAMGISRSKAYEMIAAGELPYVRIRDSIRVPRADLERWIEERKVASGYGGAQVANGWEVRI